MADINEVDTMLATKGGMYSTNRINRLATFIVDTLAKEEVNYEEAIFVLRSSEELLGARAKLVKPVIDFS